MENVLDRVEGRERLAMQLSDLVVGYEREAATLVVADADGHALAVGFDKEARLVEKQIKEQLDNALAPLKEQMGELKEFFRPYSDRLSVAREGLRQKILAYDQAQARERERAREAARRAAEESERLAREAARRVAQEQNAEALERARQAALDAEQQREAAWQAQREAEQKTETSDLGKSTITKDWKFELVDFAAVPVEYKTLDEKRINAVIRGKHGLRYIPGLRIYSVDRLTTR